MTQSVTSAERETLISYLNAQREHILGILEGLDDDALRRSLLPTGWSCIALVQHLALDVERFWFQCVVEGDAEAAAKLPDNAWQVDPDRTGADVLALYRQEIERANAIIAATPLDAAPVWWPGDLFGDWRLHELRQIILHVMTETATHAGHLDIVRELIDGHQWLVLTE